MNALVKKHSNLVRILKKKNKKTNESFKNIIKKPFFLWEKYNQKRDKNLTSQLFLLWLLVLLVLVN